MGKGKGTAICKGCGAEIYKGAVACPKCGRKNKKPFYLRGWFIATALVAIIAYFGSLGAKSQPKQSQVEVVAQPVAVTVDDLVAALKENALNASNVYKGAYIELSGKLSNIDSDGAYISLSPLKESFSLDSVICRIDKGMQEDVAKMKKGQQVSLVGTVSSVGEVLGYSVKVESFK